MDKNIKIICVVCKKEHWVTRGNRNVKCCSRGCANTYRASKILRPSCSQCSQIINRRLSHCYRNGGKDVFCDKKCEAENRKRRKIVECDVCYKKFERRISLLEKRKRKFCSKKCETIGMKEFRSSHSPRYRSYGECAILHLLRKNFPDVQFEPNDRKQLHGYEIDIWIPSMMTGIEYNGPHHFRPVYGDKIFEETKKADMKKRKIAVGKGIRIIDLDIPYSVSYTHKSRIENVFSKVCNDLNLSPSTYKFDYKKVLEERNVRHS